MKVGVILHGDPPEDAVLERLRGCDAVIAADGAAQELLRAGIVPTVIVGDMDSLDPDTQRWADSMGVEWERHPAEKDETDGELAVKRALAMGATRVVLVGLHGGRTAHFLANLRMLRRLHEARVDAVALGHGEELRFVAAGEDLDLTGAAGRPLSLVPINGDAVVSLQGTRYDGDRIILEALGTRGISNVVTGKAAAVRVHEGTVLLVLEPSPDAGA
jgi:thiamine pyrophosphokinase